MKLGKHIKNIAAAAAAIRRDLEKRGWECSMKGNGSLYLTAIRGDARITVRVSDHLPSEWGGYAGYVQGLGDTSHGLCDLSYTRLDGVWYRDSERALVARIRAARSAERAEAAKIEEEQAAMYRADARERAERKAAAMAALTDAEIAERIARYEGWSNSKKRQTNANQMIRDLRAELARRQK